MVRSARGQGRMEHEGKNGSARVNSLFDVSFEDDPMVVDILTLLSADDDDLIGCDHIQEGVPTFDNGSSSFFLDENSLDLTTSLGLGSICDQASALSFRCNANNNDNNNKDFESINTEISIPLGFEFTEAIFPDIAMPCNFIGSPVVFSPGIEEIMSMDFDNSNSLGTKEKRATKKLKLSTSISNSSNGPETRKVIEINRRAQTKVLMDALKEKLLKHGILDGLQEIKSRKSRYDVEKIHIINGTCRLLKELALKQNISAFVHKTDIEHRLSTHE